MAAKHVSRPPNSFLRMLPDAEYERLRPHFASIELVQGDVLFAAGETIRRAYLPHGSVVSLAVALSFGELVEVGMIGRDGIVGASATLERRALNNAIVQLGGPATSIEFRALEAALERNGILRALLHRHDRLLLAQAQQAAACVASHMVEERLCTFLLHARDMADSDVLPLTQENLARMLGVRRTSIALAAKRLHGARLIDSRRGQVRIVDPGNLRKAACECYEAVKCHMTSLLA